jgi:DNA-binding transcriptional LysR family regulator
MRYFEAVARHSHVTRAAAELHIAQPALSKQISQLEQELGLALFDRVGRNVRLTEAGEALLPHVRAVLAQVEAAHAEIDERLGLQRGRVSIGTSPTVGTQLLPPALLAFNQRYPGIELCLYETDRQTLLELLETGAVDVTVLTMPVQGAALMVVPLLSEDLVIITHHRHRYAPYATVHLAALRDEAWVLSASNYELRELTLSLCAEAGFTPRVVLDGSEIDTLVRMVATGLGIALVPRMAVSENGDLVVLHLEEQNVQRSLGLVWNRSRVASPAARTLREFLAEQLTTDRLLPVAAYG